MWQRLHTTTNPQPGARLPTILVWQRRDEWLCKHAVQLGRVERACVFVRTLKLVQVGIVVAVHLLQVLLPLLCEVLLVAVDALGVVGVIGSVECARSG